MDKRSMKWSLVAAAAACVAVAAMPGCELLVDFDRSKIPQDAGSVTDATTDAPQMDAQGGDSTTDAPMMGDAPSDGPVSEAGGGDASDGGGGGDASDGGGMDAKADAPSDAGSDAAADASDGAVGTAAFTISPAAVSFGTVAQTETTAAYPFTVTNGGTASGTPTVTKGGSNAGDFTVTGCGSPVAAGMSCTLMVTFSPGGLGGRGPATLNVGTGTPASVSGTGAANGTLTISPTTNDFGTVTAGMASSDFGFTVTNGDPTNTVILANPTLDGQNATQFAFDPDGGAGQCGGTPLAPSGTCTLFVHFAPTAGLGTGFQYGSVSITGTADGGLSAGAASASVTGTGQ